MEDLKSRFTSQNSCYYKSCSEIIKEAKESLVPKAFMNTRIVRTNRPFTPKNNQRILFEAKRPGRPPSSISFQNVTYEEAEIVDSHVTKRSETNPSKIKLPSLCNHQSMASLEFNILPETCSEIIAEEREIYSIPVMSNPPNLNGNNSSKWPFPLVSATEPTKLIPLRSKDKNEFKALPSNWKEFDSSIQDNKINEARAIQQLYGKDTIQNLMSAINKATIKGYKDEEMIILLQRLYECLQNDQEIQLSREQHLVKKLILKTLFSLFESSNDTLLVYVAQIILFLRVTGKNLSTLCRLIFKISRSDQNDDLFIENNNITSFVNCLGLGTPDDDCEALIYGYGALKFLMMNELILDSALSSGILQLMALHLKMVNNSKSEGMNCPWETSHVLFQLTGCLRNVANEESTHSKFVSSGTLTALCKTVRLFITDIDLLVNVARILSILSTNQECCDLICDDEYALHTLLKISKRYPGREDVIVRVMYAIGNVLANCDRARFQLYSSSEGTLGVILNLLNFYLETDLKLCLENSLNKSYLQSIEDVFIKIIRVIANMSLDENVGMVLVSELFQKTNEFLNCLITLMRRKTIHESEELILSVLSTLNNLSYYSHPHPFLEGSFIERYLDICEALNSQISTRDEECILEVGRVYGNLSRVPVVRKYLIETGSLNYVVDWLDSENKDLLLVTTGVLINMMIEIEARHFLKCTKGIEKLVHNLCRYAEEDWHLAALICQVIWNFSVGEDDLFSTLGFQEARTLLYNLVDLLDEDRYFPNSNNDHQRSAEYKLWEEFSSVGTNLLERMEIRNNCDQQDHHVV